jgi:glycerophosphoryl diester phosphodiesterase
MAARFPSSPSRAPLVVAHRGGSALAPENTMAAFDRAVSLGVDGLELDVRLSRDGVVMVHHDRDLGRTANATGPLAALTADELARVDAAHAFGAPDGFPLRGRGIGIPRLADVLARHRDVFVVIELKGRDPAVARAAVADVRDADAADRVCFGGFARAPLAEVRRLAPEIATSAGREETRLALYLSWIGARPPFARYRAFQIPECAGSTRVVSPRFVRVAHRGGRAVQVWTVDRAEDMHRLFDWGVDAVITDRPDVGMRVKAERGG